MKKANEIISRYPPQYKKAAVIPLLDLGQRQNDNWTSLSVMNCPSRFLSAPRRLELGLIRPPRPLLASS